jgi:8-oxo-dGTP diphosphatase
MKVKVRATVVCSRADCVLLISKDGSKWALPGGWPDRDEPFIDAAGRALMGTTLLAGKLRYLFQVVGAATVHHVFIVQIPDAAEPAPGNDIVRCEWFSYASLNEIYISPMTRQIIEGYWMRCRR